MVMADQGQIEQVLMNLAIYARDAMPQGGTLRITTANSVLDADFTRRNLGSHAGAYVAVRLPIRVCGMTPEVLSHLFEPFYTTKPPGRGTGLGLATVHDIVTTSGGCLTVESQQGVARPSRSTGRSRRRWAPRRSRRGVEHWTVSGRKPFCWPKTTAASANRPQDAGTIRIHGAAPEVPADAASIAADHPGAIDLLITDIVMPGLSGPALAQRVVGFRPHIPGAVRVGLRSHRHPYPGAMSTNTGFLQKPFTARTIAQKVRECLDRPRDDQSEHALVRFCDRVHASPTVGAFRQFASIRETWDAAARFPRARGHHDTRTTRRDTSPARRQRPQGPSVPAPA